MAIETKAMDQVLAQLRAASARVGMNGVGGAAAPASAAGAAGIKSNANDFAAVLKASLDHVNGTQAQAAKMARDFELGAPGVNLPDVMVAIQKSNISFQQTVQVRNRLVSAYHEIMNMQV